MLCLYLIIPYIYVCRIPPRFRQNFEYIQEKDYLLLLAIDSHRVSREAKYWFGKYLVCLNVSCLESFRVDGKFVQTKKNNYLKIKCSRDMDVFLNGFLMGTIEG